jgi:integrase
MAIIRRKKRDGSPSYMARMEIVRDDGSRGQRIVGTFDTLREAKIALAKAIASRESGTLLNPDTTTVSELLDEWLRAKAGSVTANTLHDYETTIRLHIKPTLGAVRIQKLTAARLQSQYTAWRDAGLSARVIRGCHMRLSQALDYGVRVKLLLHNPAKDAHPPRLAQARCDHWSPAEAAAFLNVAKQDSLASLWHLLLLEGLRRGEGLGLRWQDLDLEAGEARIVQSVIPNKADRGSPIIQRRVKTTSGARSVRLTQETAQSLRAHRIRWLERKVAATDWEDNDLVFSTRTGKPINPTNLIRQFRAIVATAGVRPIRLHDLRHSCASLLLLAGEHPKVVSDRLGHASVAITLDLYSHVSPRLQTQAAERMSELIASAREP